MSTKDTNPKDAVGVRKVPVSTVPVSVVSELGLAMLEGARKYGRHNFRVSGVRASVYIDAVWRHLFQQFWDEGEDMDSDSGLSHVIKAIASLVVLRDSMLKGNWVDDRPVRAYKNTGTFNKKASTIIDKYPNAKEPFTQKAMLEQGSSDLDKPKAHRVGRGDNHIKFGCFNCENMRTDGFCIKRKVPSLLEYHTTTEFCDGYELEIEA